MKLEFDPDMAEDGQGFKACFASLSHSHLDVSFRNCLAGKRGCECSSVPAVAGMAVKKCVCDNRPILDEHGNYSMSALQVHDPEWWRACTIGLEWEILGHKMEVDQPDAVAIVCIALNKKNEAAM